MNGHAQPCGCFDGHYLDGDEEPVALRCARHAKVPAEIPGAAVRTLAEINVSRLTLAGARPSRARGGTVTGRGSVRARGRRRR